MPEVLSYLTSLSDLVIVVLIIALAIIFRKEIGLWIRSLWRPEEAPTKERSLKDEIIAAFRDANQPIMLEVSALKEYANHSTTEHLRELTIAVRELVEGIKGVHAKHDEWDKFGIPTRDCAKK